MFFINKTIQIEAILCIFLSHLFNFIPKPRSLMRTATLFRGLVPALLLVGLTLSSCNCRKDDDPRPKKGKCGTKTTTTGTKPGGAS